jgi:hypothetical protein
MSDEVVRVMALPDYLRLLSMLETREEEVCGLLKGRDLLTWDVRPNMADDRRHGYALGEDVVREVWTSDRVVGVWHTHPRGPMVPSEIDLKGWTLPPGRLCGIVGWYQGLPALKLFEIIGGAVASEAPFEVWHLTEAWRRLQEIRGEGE